MEGSHGGKERGHALPALEENTNGFSAGGKQSKKVKAASQVSTKATHDCPFASLLPCLTLGIRARVSVILLSVWPWDCVEQNATT